MARHTDIAEMRELNRVYAPEYIGMSEFPEWTNAGRRVARSILKELITEAMGGKCQCCGYRHKKTLASFDFHHIDPSIKERGVMGNGRDADLRNVTPRAWRQLVEEAVKCVLLCANCHREYHAGVRSLPKNIKTVNPNYVKFRPEWFVRWRRAQYDEYCATDFENRQIKNAA